MGKKTTKSISKGFKKVGKSISKGVKKVGKTIVKGVKDIGLAAGSLVKKGLGAVGSALSAIGLESIGREVKRWGEDLGQVLAVLSGEYHDRARQIEAYRKKVEEAQKSYEAGINNLVDRMASLVAFHEIFHLAMKNRLDKYMAQYGPVLETMVAQYQALIRKLKEDFDFVIGLTEGAFLQRLIGSLIMTIGGLMSDMGDILSGKADGATWKRLVTTASMVIAIVLLFVVPGLQGVSLAIAVSLSAIAAFMTLDGMYANGAATGAIMGVLDFIFNDLLNLDALIGSDFNKFDKDHEDYQEMVMYTQLSFSLGSMAVSWASAPAQVSAGGAAQDAGLAANTSNSFGGALVVGDTMATSSFLGVSFSTYSDIYKAFSTASAINDVVAANDQYEKMKEKFKEDIAKLDSAIDSKYRKSFMKHYKDTAYFLQDQQEHIDRYVWGMTAQSMYVDPYGTTPVANIRFTPDSGTRGLGFGFEDMFDENTIAGSKGYFDNIIYGS